MSMFAEQLVLKALAALSEIADECGKEPARKSLSFRFLLAYTFVAAGADPKIKWLWSDFWRHATAPKKTGPDELVDEYCRGTGARSALNGICREIGYAPESQFLEMLKAARQVRRRELASTTLMPANDQPSDDGAA